MKGTALAAVSAAVILSLAAAACGGGKSAAGGGGGGGTGGCVKGAAGSGNNVSTPKEPDSGVNTPAGKCWAQIAGTPFSNVMSGTPPSGAKAEFKTAWSDKYFYAWTQVTLGRAPICTNAANSWNDDTVEFYVSPTNDRGGAYPANTGQFLVNSCGENNVGAPGPQLGADHSKVTLTSASNGVETKTSTGYTVVLKLAWSDLAAKPAAKTQVGFTVGVDFADTSNPGTRLAQTMWAGTSTNWDDDSQWGVATLA